MVVAAGAGPVTATAPTSTVSLVGCAGGGGNATVPAGNNVVVQFGLLADTAGHLRDFIAAATIIASINGTLVPNASRYWSTPSRFDPSHWVTYWRYGIGTLGSGEDVDVVFDVSLARVVVSSRGPDPFLAPPGDLFDPDLACTITGA
jgi:hypothetical protein